MQNLHLTFDCMYCSQQQGEDFAKFCGLLRIYELYYFYLTFKIFSMYNIVIWQNLIKIWCNLVYQLDKILLQMFPTYIIPLNRKIDNLQILFTRICWVFPQTFVKFVFMFGSCHFRNFVFWYFGHFSCIILLLFIFPFYLSCLARWLSKQT